MSEPPAEPGATSPDPEQESAAGDLPTAVPGASSGSRAGVNPAPTESSAEDDEDEAPMALPPPLIGRDPSASTPNPAESRPAVTGRRKPGPSWVTLGTVTLGLLVAFVLCAPWLASQSLLNETARRSVRAVGGENAGVVQARLGWTSGLTLDRVYLPDARPGMPALVLRELRLDTNLVQGASGYFWGDTVVAKLVAREGRISFGQAPAEPAPVGSATPAPPTSEAEASEPFRLPFPIRPSIDFSGIDLEIHWQPGDVDPRRAVFSGIRASGGGLIKPDLALQLDEGLSFSVDSLSVERLEDAGPAQVFGLEDAEFSTERLVVPAPEEFTAFAVDTRFAIQAKRLRFEDIRLHDVSAELGFKEGVADLKLGAKEERGALTLSSTTDMRDPLRWPCTLDLQLSELDLSPELRARMPLLIPLVAATSADTGTPGLPPLSLKLDATFDVVFDEDGAFDEDATASTIQGQGEFTLSKGQLHSSLLIDGYVRALLNVSVASFTEKLVPPVFEVDEVKGSFSVEDGVVTLPRIELRAPRLGLLIAGTVRFDGSFEVLVTTLLPEGELGVAQKLAKAIDQAGGVTLFGNLTDQTVDFRLPPADAILAAVQAQGVVESLGTATGDLGDRFRELLEKGK